MWVPHTLKGNENGGLRCGIGAFACPSRGRPAVGDGATPLAHFQSRTGPEGGHSCPPLLPWQESRGLGLFAGSVVAGRGGYGLQATNRR